MVDTLADNEPGAVVGSMVVDEAMQELFELYKADLMADNSPPPGDNGGSGFGMGFQIMCGPTQLFSFGMGGGGGVGLRYVASVDTVTSL